MAQQCRRRRGRLLLLRLWCAAAAAAVSATVVSLRAAGAAVAAGVGDRSVSRETVRATVAARVEDGVRSHRQANPGLGPRAALSLPRAGGGGDDTATGAAGAAASISVTVDGVAHDARVHAGGSLDKAAADFCLAVGIASPGDCHTVRASLAQAADAAGLRLAPSGRGAAAQIIAPAAGEPAPRQFTSQRIYFNATVGARTRSRWRKLCYHMDFGPVPLFCATPHNISAELTYLPRPSFTRAGMAPGWHVLHLKPNTEVVRLRSPLADARFFYVAAPRVQILSAVVQNANGIGDDDVVVVIRVEISSFRPGVDGALCLLRDWHMVGCYGNAAPDWGEDKRAAAGTLRRPSPRPRALALDDVRVVVDGSGGSGDDLVVDVKIRRRETTAGTAADRDTSPVLAAVLMSASHHAKAVALSNFYTTEGASVDPVQRAAASVDPVQLWASLRRDEWGLWSQNGEDGVLLSLLHEVGLLGGGGGGGGGPRYFVEFGVEDGSECNTRILRERFRWDGLLMDGSHGNASIGLAKHFITAEAINGLFAAHGVPAEIDLLSVDLDFNDWHVLEAVLRAGKFKPKVVAIEYNGHVPPEEPRTVAYNASRMWDGATDYSGAGTGAIAALGARHGFRLVYCETHGVNAFLVRDTLLMRPGGGEGDFSWLDAARRVHQPANFFGRDLTYPPGPGEWVNVV